MNEKQKLIRLIAGLPTITSIAVLLMIAWGIFGVLEPFIGHFLTSLECGDSCGGVSYRFVGLSCLLFLPPMLIYMKNKIAWILAIILLFGMLASILTKLFSAIISCAREYNGPYDIYGNQINYPCSDVYTFSLILLAVLIPLILIIIDGKKYFKMLRQRKSDKELIL